MDLPVRVLISDPQPVVRAGLRAYLEACQEFSVAGECAELADIGRSSLKLEPDIVLFGHRLYHLDWEDLVKNYIARASDVKVVLLCATEDKRYIPNALRAGFRGIFLKESPLEDLRDAISAVNGGSIWCDDSVTSDLLETLLDGGPDSADPGTPLQRLTPRQRRIVDLVCEGFSNHQIASSVLVSQATVAYELTQIYRELSIFDRTQLIVHFGKTRNPPEREER